MPFDLYISRAPTLAAIRGEPSPPPKPGLLARMFSKSTSGAASIASEEFHAAMNGSPASRKQEHTYWVTHPDGGPWFVAAWQPGGHVLLSTSYSNHRFLRNFPDMVDLGIRLAGALKARLFEETGAREVTAKNVDALLDPGGDFVGLQASTWRHVLDQVATEARAPLEYPLDAIDLVREFLLFLVEPQQAVADDEVAGLVARAVDGVKVEAAEPGAFAVLASADDTWLTKILRRPDGAWQVWPAWGPAPFSRVAEVTVGVAEQLGDATRGAVRFLDQPYTASLRADVRSRIDGLGVDFYLWTRELGRDRRDG